MFEYCRGRHVDPSYIHVGTVDYGILDPKSGILLLYSVVNTVGQPLELQLYHPYRFQDLAANASPKPKNLHELFVAANAHRSEGEVEFECSRVKKGKLIPLVLKDVASLSPRDQAAIESMIGEAF